MFGASMIPDSFSLPEKGVLAGALAKIAPPLPKPRRTRVAVLGCCVRIHFPFADACSRYQAAIRLARETLDAECFEVVSAPEPFEDPDSLLAFADGLLAEGLGGIIFFHAAYTAGEIGSHFGRWLAEHKVPVLSWSFPDPPAERLSANSLCCQNFLLGMWKRLRVRYAWMHEPLENTAAPALARFGRSVRARDRFRHAKVLHAGGSRVTAFYDGETDELAVMKRFGLRFDRVEIEAVYQKAKQFPEADVKLLADTLKSDPRCAKVDLPDTQIFQTLRFGLALYTIGAEHGYLGCTFKSWPELFDCYGCAIDGAVSMLNDAGFCTAEEGEMNGLISSLALYLLSEGRAVPVLMDLSALDAAKNRIGIWHCGACATRVLKPGATYALTKHSILENGDPETAVGMMIEFLLALGPATVVRYQSPDAARFFSFEGELVDSPMPFRGSWCELQPRAPATASRIMGTILSAGLDHHWSLGYGHWNDDLAMLNHWLGVETVPLGNGAVAHGLSE
jgi:L-fucose isomerase-like protein